MVGGIRRFFLTSRAVVAWANSNALELEQKQSCQDLSCHCPSQLLVLAIWVPYSLPLLVLILHDVEQLCKFADEALI
jgi:hypothetical protein